MQEQPTGSSHRWIRTRVLPAGGEVRYQARATGGGIHFTSAWGTLEEALAERDAVRAEAAEARRKMYKKRQRQPNRSPEVIYFIQVGDSGPIKIGRTKSNIVETRLGNLQIANAEELRLLGTVRGDFTAERELHRCFEHLRIRGEWFTNAPEIHQTLAENPTWIRGPQLVRVRRRKW